MPLHRKTQSPFLREGVLVGKITIWQIYCLANLPCGKFTMWQNYHLANILFGKFTVWQIYHLANLLFGKFTVWHQNKLEGLCSLNKMIKIILTTCHVIFCSQHIKLTSSLELPNLTFAISYPCLCKNVLNEVPASFLVFGAFTS